MDYDEACARHRWNVPERHNIAADICDRQPPDRTAMIFEDFRGDHRELSWSEQGTLGVELREAERKRVEAGGARKIGSPG